MLRAILAAGKLVQHNVTATSPVQVLSTAGRLKAAESGQMSVRGMLKSSACRGFVQFSESPVAKL
jgi:hypothetical protein